MFAALTLVAYWLGSRCWGSVPLGETMAFATLALGQLVHAFNVRSRHSLFRVGFHTNRYMLWAFLCSLALLLAALLIPGVQGIFSVVAMDATAWGAVAGLSVAPLLLVELAKLLCWLLKKYRG